jgi:L-histidine Nalpha-methyltransferase
VLHVLNRELGADFDPAGFAHLAFWDEVNSWIDIRLRSLADQTVTVGALDMRVEFSEGEEMRTEISSKFTREQLEAIYCEVGLELVEWWTDAERLFALSLAKAA